MKTTNKTYEYNLFKGNKIYSKNGDLIIITENDIEVEKAFAIDGKAMEMIKKLDPEDVKVVDGKLLIKNKKQSYKALLLEEKAFNIENYEKSFNIEGKFLKRASEFVDKKAQRVILTGVNINNTSVVGTNSFYAYKYNLNESIDVNIIVPTEFINCLPDGIVEIKYNERSISCTVNGITYISRLIDGNYPSVANIFKERGKEYHFSKIELVGNMNLCQDMLAKFSKGKMIIGNLESEIINDCDVDFAVDYNYLKTALKIIDNCDFFIDTDKTPITWINGDESILLLPVKIN